MKKNKVWLSVTLVLVLAALVAAWVLSHREQRGIVAGTLVDELSQGPVWHATIVINGRSTVKFSTTEFRLSEIEPGEHTLKVKAPKYVKIEQPITVKSGLNIVNIAMKGSGIPELEGILAFSEPLEKGLRVEIRLTDSYGVAITDHPAIECRLEVALALREGVEPPYAEGMQVFAGPLDLFWDRKDSLARYKGIIPWNKMAFRPKHNAIGILEATLITPQGTFKFTNEEIEFFKKVLE